MRGLPTGIKRRSMQAPCEACLEEIRSANTEWETEEQRSCRACRVREPRLQPQGGQGAVKAGLGR